MKIVTLIDNSCTANNLQAEHGLSFYIETQNHKVIFDTGQSGAFLMNAQKLSIDIQQVDIIIISHGHYDHLGGLMTLLQINAKAKVYLKKEIFDSNYFSVRKGLSRQIGYSPELEKYKDRFCYVDKLTQIDELMLMGHISKPFPVPKGNGILFRTDGDTLVQDDFNHELILAININQEVYIFSGCAHSGILNILHTVQKNIRYCTIKMIVGGFHLIEKNDFIDTETAQEIRNIATEINKISEEILIYTGHCTGASAASEFKKIFGERLDFFTTGKSIHV